ncbi:SURF1 family protein [Limnobacter humi]|uniref:SURF1-like protein n=1 Tax=Limnobacter humi TaxID=1778671 RepID=A0ABT1WJH5_9BURK|nr:SURF1 family protein [Limnobacter humi]MCQ8897663.1 SURF1 family protein [Limnobacter humi]
MDKSAQPFSRSKWLLTAFLGFSMAWGTWSLGNWQTRRGDEKQALHDHQAQALKAAPISPQSARVDLDNLSYRKILLHGQYLADAVVYVDNRQFNGLPAVMVVQGFQPTGQHYVIPVDRGLLLRDPANPRKAPPLPSTAPGEVELTGTILPRFAQAAELFGFKVGGAASAIHEETDQGRRVWSNFSSDAFAQLMKEPVSNFVVTLQPVADTDQTGQGARQQDGFYMAAVGLPEQVARHRGYAFQWYGMTVALGALTLFLLWKEFRFAAETNR